ncbi:MAG: dTDP-glucose 46-dehydratase [Mucilaginibacter sp.]|nr:dTDP-glucose 46-dehydratase [Mucilaginibacter sp.]
MLNNTNKIIADDITNVISSNIVNWNLLQGKTVLITGANGFLPAYMVYTLLKLNDAFSMDIKILALVRNYDKAAIRFEGSMDRPDIKFIIQDVSDPIDITEKIDFIVHAASQASPKFYGSDPVGTINANVQGTLNLLKLARKNNVDKFLYFSSSEIYGTVTPEKEFISENDFGYIDLLNVRSCYAESKRMGETMCISWMHQYNIPVSFARIFHSYGPGMDLQDGRVFADFIADIVNNKDIVMQSDGTAVRAFCYLTDATLAFFLILLCGKNGEAYNMGNPACESSVISLADKLVNLFPEKKLKVVQKQIKKEGYIKSPVHRVVPDVSKLIKLGWQPVVSIEQGFKRTISSYTNQLLTT